MGAFDRIFGLTLMIAGIAILSYYTLWMLYSLVSKVPLIL